MTSQINGSEANGSKAKGSKAKGSKAKGSKAKGSKIETVFFFGIILCLVLYAIGDFVIGS